MTFKDFPLPTLYLSLCPSFTSQTQTDVLLTVEYMDDFKGGVVTTWRWGWGDTNPRGSLSTRRRRGPGCSPRPLLLCLRRVHGLLLLQLGWEAHHSPDGPLDPWLTELLVGLWATLQYFKYLPIYPVREHGSKYYVQADSSAAVRASVIYTIMT